MDTKEALFIIKQLNYNAVGELISSLVNSGVDKDSRIEELIDQRQEAYALNSRNLDKRDAEVEELGREIKELRNEIQIQKNSAERYRRDADRWHDDANLLRQTVDRLQGENTSLHLKYSAQYGKAEAAHSVMKGLLMTNFIDELFGTDEHDARYDLAWQYAPLFLVDAIHSVDKFKKIERIKVFRRLIAGTGLKQTKDFIEADPQYREEN